MNRKVDSNDLRNITKNLNERAAMMKYTGDLSDLGNEIGLIIGKYYEDFTSEEILDFISGFKHGISLTNGTH